MNSIEIECQLKALETNRDEIAQGILIQILLEYRKVFNDEEALNF